MRTTLILAGNLESSTGDYTTSTELYGSLLAYQCCNDSNFYIWDQKPSTI